MPVYCSCAKWEIDSIGALYNSGTAFLRKGAPKRVYTSLRAADAQDATSHVLYLPTSEKREEDAVIIATGQWALGSSERRSEYLSRLFAIRERAGIQYCEWKKISAALLDSTARLPSECFLSVFQVLEIGFENRPRLTSPGWAEDYQYPKHYSISIPVLR